MSDSSIALKPVIEEPSKPIPASNASSSSAGVDRERLQLAEDVREPEADEADVPLLDDRLHVLGALGHVCHAAGPYTGPGAAAIDVWPKLPAASARPFGPRFGKGAARRGAAKGISGRRRRLRSSPPVRLPCPGRDRAGICPRPRARPSAIALSTSALRPAGVAMSSPTRTSRFGPMRPTDLTAASVWQTAHDCANRSRPFCCAALRWTPPARHRGLVAAVEGQHERRDRQAEGEQRPPRRASPGACPPSIPRAASASCRRASPRRTRRGRAGPRR